MIIEQAIITALLADSALIAVVGQRIYPVLAPQDIEAPYVVINKISGPRNHSMGGSSHLVNPRFQFSCFATTYAVAKQVSGLIQTVLQGYSGTLGGVGGVAVNGCFYEDETDMYEDDTKLFHVALDFKLWHEE